MASEDSSQSVGAAANETISRASWVAVAAAIAMMACLCGLAAGSIMVSAGVAAYAGLSGVAITEVAAGGPTYTPLPTYTLPATYTPLPTYTIPAAGEILPMPSPTLTPTFTAAPAPLIAPTLPGQATTYPGPADAYPAPNLTQDATHTVEAGETLETIAQRYGVDVVQIAYVNNLNLLNPQLTPGMQLTIPANISSSCVPTNQAVEAEVTRVISGDTIEVSIGGQPFTVRYIGVNAPEIGPPAESFSEEALIANQDLVEGQTVTLIDDVTNADNNGALPRYVLLGGTFINYEIARGGFGRAAPMPPDVSCDELFAMAADRARVENVGLWATGGAQGTPPLPGTSTGSPPPPTPGTGTPPPVTFATPTPGQATPLASGWTPPPSLTPTSTSSLGFTCNCAGPGRVWGNFYNLAQAELCQSICEIAAARRAAACATAAAVGGSLVGCR